VHCPDCQGEDREATTCDFGRTLHPVSCSDGKMFLFCSSFTARTLVTGRGGHGLNNSKVDYERDMYVSFTQFWPHPSSLLVLSFVILMVGV
jgi:hypothetical protein